MYIVGDLVRDFNINLQYTLQGILSYGQIDRSFVVADIGDGDGVSQPVDFGPAALAFLQSNASGYNLSIGQPHPVYTQLTFRNMNVRGIDSNNEVSIVASYVYNQIPYETTIWTIESSTYTEFLETDIQYNPNYNASSSGSQQFIPIQIGNYVQEWSSYQNSAGIINSSPQGQNYQTTNGTLFTVQPAPPAYGVVTAAKVRKRWDYTATIYDPAAATTFDAACISYVNYVNTSAFTGTTTGVTAQNFNFPAGTVYCFAAGISFNLTSGQYIARCSMVYKPEGWQPWARYTNPQLGGVPPNIWRAGNLGGTAYAANGTIQVIEYPSTNLNTLLTLI